ncbi:MAG: PKD domain-containing protein, partial [Bacteroidota bacterium]
MKKIYLLLILVFLAKCNFAALVVTITNPNTSNTTICQGGTINFTCSASGGNGVITYQWKDNNDNVGTNSQNYLYTAGINAIDTIRIIITDSLNNTATTFVVVTVNPKPAINSITTTICSGDIFTLTPINNTNGIVPVGTTYTWNAPSVTGGITGGAPSSGNPTNINGTLINLANIPHTATYTITPKSGANCTGSTFTVTVTVNPLPQGSLTGSTICNGGIGQLTFTSISGINPFTLVINGSSYSGINSGIPFNVNSNPVSTTSYSLTSITDNNGCIRTGITGISATIIVNPLPIISANANPSPICKGGASIITASGNSSSYVWNGLGSGATQTVHPITTTTYTVTGTSIYGCSSTATVAVIVNPLPIPKLIDVSNNNFILCNTKILFVKDASIANTNIQQTIIKWGDGLSDQYNNSNYSTNKNHTYSSYGSYTVTYLVVNNYGCEDSVKYYISIIAKPGFTITWPPVYNTCDTSTYCISLTGISQNSDSTIYTYNFGDGYSVFYPHPPPANVCHEFHKTTCDSLILCHNSPYIITITAAILTCSQSTTGGNLSVFQKPKASFISQQEACVNQSLSFINTTIHGFNNLMCDCDSTTDYFWDFGDGSTSSAYSPTHIYSSAGIYNVTLIATNYTCFNDTIIHTICVKSPPLASFSVYKNTFCASDTVNINNTSNTLSQCGTTFYSWSISCSSSGCSPSCNYSYTGGTDSTFKNPKILFNNYGNYIVTLNVNNGCGSASSFSQSIIVKKKPEISILNVPSSICNNSSINPTNNNNACNGTIINWNWTFSGGNPSSSNQPIPGSINYTSAGIDTVTLTATNECGTSTQASVNFTVYPIPTVTVGLTQTICQESTTSGLSGSIGGSATGGIWSSIPTGGTFSPNATTLNATWTPPVGYNGTAILTLTTTGMSPCAAVYTSVNIIVKPLPTVTVGLTQTICQESTTSGLSGTIGGSATGGIWSSIPTGGT